MLIFIEFLDFAGEFLPDADHGPGVEFAVFEEVVFDLGFGGGGGGGGDHFEPFGGGLVAVVDGEGGVGAFGAEDGEDFFDGPAAVEVAVAIVEFTEGVAEVGNASVDGGDLGREVGVGGGGFGVDADFEGFVPGKDGAGGANVGKHMLDDVAQGAALAFVDAFAVFDGAVGGQDVERVLGGELLVGLDALVLGDGVGDGFVVEEVDWVFVAGEDFADFRAVDQDGGAFEDFVMEGGAAGELKVGREVEEVAVAGGAEFGD